MEVYLKSFHELSGSRLCDGTEVVDQVCLGHADATVDYCKGAVVLVGNDGDLHFLLAFQHRRVGQTLVADLVQGLWKMAGGDLSNDHTASKPATYV